MKIPAATDTAALDAATTAAQGITSLQLMERAARAFVGRFVRDFPDPDRPVYLGCGTGNNGGDGWAVARLLHHEHGRPVTVIDCRVGEGKNRSADNAANRARAGEYVAIQVVQMEKGSDLPTIPHESIYVDALFGAGLSRPLTGYWETFIQHVNQQLLTRVAVDLPSGLFADRHTAGTTLQAHHTYTFDYPKLALLLPENGRTVGELSICRIQIDATALAASDSENYYLTGPELAPEIRERRAYDHKGTFGHALLIAGSYGKIGAATLAARAILRGGAGLVTVHLPRCGYEIMQISFPEAMCMVDPHRYVFSQAPESLAAYQAIGVGPGLGQDPLTQTALHDLLEHADKPLVMDADALNLLGEQPEWWPLLPENSILTPHPKEFERLFGTAKNDFSRLDLLRDRAREHRCIIVLKTGHTTIAAPDGRLFFNSTGNPGMGTGGTGDVLTGIITGLLAQGYAPLTAARLGVYLHGSAGDLAAAALTQESLIAEDVIGHIGAAIRALRT